MFPELFMIPHVVLGVLGTFAAFAVFLETLASQPHLGRLRAFSMVSAVTMWLAFIAGGAFYLKFYGVDKAIILDGPWPWAHKFVMETKEHWAIFLPLLTAMLPLAVGAKGFGQSPSDLRIVRTAAFLVLLLGLAMEGMGATLAMAVRLGLGQ